MIGNFAKRPGHILDSNAHLPQIIGMTEQEKTAFEARAAIFKALGHATRLYILDQLSRAPHCVCELTEMVGADTSTVSKHLAILKNVGLVRSEKRGTTVYYKLACGCLRQFMEGAESLLRMKAEADRAVLSSGSGV